LVPFTEILDHSGFVAPPIYQNLDEAESSPDNPEVSPKSGQAPTSEETPTSGKPDPQPTTKSTSPEDQPATATKPTHGLPKSNPVDTTPRKTDPATVAPDAGIPTGGDLI